VIGHFGAIHRLRHMWAIILQCSYLGVTATVPTAQIEVQRQRGRVARTRVRARAVCACACAVTVWVQVSGGDGNSANGRAAMRAGCARAHLVRACERACARARVRARAVSECTWCG
jgi:hypothetical protein